ncbi:MAG: FxsA family protein [Aeromonadaceae bacterium]
MGKFFLGLLGLFFLEIWVLIKVGSSIGALTTLILMVVAALLGGQLVRSQGVATLISMRNRMQQGEAPAGDMLQGLWLAVAGFLFIFPGFVSDIVALLLLQPAVRRLLTLWLLKQSFIKMQAHGAAFTSTTYSQAEKNVFGEEISDMRGQTSTQNSNESGSAKPKGTTIEGEFERKE